MVSELKYIELSSLLLEKPRNGLYKSKEYQGRGNRWIKMKEVFNTDFLLNQETELIEVTNSELKKFSCRPGDLLFGRTSLTLEGVGDCLLVGEIQDTPIFESNLFRVRFDDNKADSLFYYYFFKSKAGKQLIQKIAKQTAAASITSSDLVSQFVPYYPLEYQKSVSQLIYQFDEKIELNRQMNETLEAMAQALFKSWFVDFDPVIDNALLTGKAIPEPLKECAELRQAQLDSGKAKANSKINDLFPSEFEFTEELGWIPKGWSVCYFKNIVEKYIDNRGKTPPLSESGIPLIEVKHISDNSLKPSLDTSKYVDRETYNTWFRAHLETDDIIISTVGTIGRICIVSEGDEFCIAQNLLGFRFNQEKALPSFMYYQMDSNIFRHDVNARLVTTVQSSIKRKDLETIPLLIPDMHIQEEFNKTVAPLMEKQNLNSNINLSLANLRDTLLPKLMSGELRIADAEKLAENI
ncbi:MAG: restriction endonuclease subunit S [Psychrobacter sp.]|nr:restriction endonuclease subunit S [Psychrobacter sp.]